METLTMWLIIIGIGLVVGFIVHAAIRNAEGSSVITTLLAGVVGALIAARFVTPFVYMPTMSVVAERFLWAVIGGAVLSLITELSFAGTKQGRVITT